MDGYVNATEDRHLTDSNLALVVMFITNWVHRDVSTGNILFLGEDLMARGKLSDLEYAKEFESASPSSTDPKTVRVSPFFGTSLLIYSQGTSFFMALELLSGKLLYSLYHLRNRQPAQDPRDTQATLRVLQRKVKAEPTPDPEMGELRPTRNVLAEEPGPPMKTPDPVVYNFQHDLESLWWIILWILTTRVDHLDSQLYAQSIFINELGCSNERANIFTPGEYLADRLREVLHHTLVPFIDILTWSCNVL